MSDEPTVAVRGSAVVEADPEIARLTVTVQSQDKDRAKALRAVVAGSDAVKQVLAGYGAAVDKAEDRAVQVRPQFRDEGRSRRVEHYLGLVQIMVTVTDFTVLGDMVLRLGELDLLALEGPFWGLRPTSPVHRQARIDAVKDARVRASDYAEAAGGALLGLVSIADTGMSHEGKYDSALGEFRSASMVAGQIADQMQWDLTPVRQTVRGAVEARFVMSQPDFALPQD
jgi:uncharacterized protein YggE